MTAARVHDARMLIPGAYESNAPPHRATRPARVVPAAPSQDESAGSAGAATPYVVAAPASPTTLPGYAAAVLGDLGLLAAILFAVSLAPALVVLGIKAAAALILGTSGGN